jgi:hypothetical protein
MFRVPVSPTPRAAEIRHIVSASRDSLTLSARDVTRRQAAGRATPRGIFKMPSVHLEFFATNDLPDHDFLVGGLSIFL